MCLALIVITGSLFGGFSRKNDSSYLDLVTIHEFSAQVSFI